MKPWHLRGQVEVGNDALSQPVLHYVTVTPVPDSHTHRLTEANSRLRDSQLREVPPTLHDFHLM